MRLSGVFLMRKNAEKAIKYRKNMQKVRKKQTQIWTD